MSFDWLEGLVVATILKMIKLEEFVQTMSFLEIITTPTVLGWLMALQMTGRWPRQRLRNKAEASTDDTA